MKEEEQAVFMKKMKTLAQRRQSAPTLVISKALSKSRTASRESCLSPISPETCPLVQSFVCPNRVFVMDSHVQLKTGLQTQERHLFLFNDILVIAKSKSSLQFKLKTHVCIRNMWTASCVDEVCEGSPNADTLNRSFVLGWPTTNCAVTFSSVDQKEAWLSFIKSKMKEEKEKDDPKQISINVLTRGIENCVQPKTLTVSNTDTVVDVIHMALQQFEIHGNVKDFQLWVTSGKEDSPYPLIGHEYPFSIKMSHMREAQPQSLAANKDASSIPDPLEELPLDKQCQFILKPSRLASGQQLTDSRQKPFKRKRSIINWAFWRGSGSQLDSLPVSPTSPTAGCLFGLPLSVVCSDDSLPKPVMDMLCCLFQEGPFTRGIFRRSANAKACRELRDKLNSGAEALLSCESVFVAAAVFKDFLRNIPGCILSLDLYDKWISIIEKGNREEKINDIKRLLEQLPKENLLLLKHLFGVLHCIEQKSEENQMNAFNLAVCIAPSMLWSPTPSSPQVQSEDTKKVSTIVQFMIENCCKIFGEDLLLLFESIPKKCNSSDQGSDVSSFQMNDSSYDSLENELNDDGDCAFSELRSKCGQDNRSRDSVITLSDCDVEQTEAERVYVKLPPLSTTRRFSPETEEIKGVCECIEKDTVAPKVSRRHRRCSEPSICLLTSDNGEQFEQHEAVLRKASYDALIASNEENYLKQLRSLQLEGRELINRSMNMGIDLNKLSVNSSSERKDAQNGSRLKMKPPPPLRLNLCPTPSSSSLSSPGTSPSGSSMSSLDSAFSQYSDYSVFTPTETCVPISFLTQQSTSPSLCSPFSQHHSDSSSCSSPVLENNYAICCSKEGPDWMLQKSPLTLHPNSWLKNSTPSSRSWSLRNKELRSKQEEKSKGLGRTHFVEDVKPQGKLTDSFSEDEPYNKDTSYEVGRRHFSRLPSYQEAVHQAQQKNINVPFYQLQGREKESTAIAVPMTSKAGSHLSTRKVVKNTVSLRPPMLKFEKCSSSEKNIVKIPQAMFYGQSSSLHVYPTRRQHSRSFTLAEECQKSAAVRRCSEPGTARHSPTAQKVKFELPQRSQSHKLKTSSDTEPSNDNPDPKFALSPAANQAVQEYFLQTDMENCVQKAQEVTRAVIQSKREWQSKRCSDPKFEDFDQLLFAEESYV
ncbi:rho GTPase-activating protein 20 isoform X2 [Erpetoichthys calabaricus]|uniref:rho GTPase-activating protein 20 isoform X2 n=1 Tax=Erpetoichthys calabaricus TaxID=27687 RepID=UPI00223460DD|nr:rho GTPase-activating protein 20 isoform X2 [Erpetoichthys calabaricus]